MEESDIQKVIETWCREFQNLSSLSFINYVQIFENKGSIMGNSNPHPHGQIWAQESIPLEITKELKQFKKYYKRYKHTLLSDYLKLEIKLDERIVFQNNSFVAMVPYWAVWPYEILIISKRKLKDILQLNKQEKKDFANVLKV